MTPQLEHRLAFVLEAAKNPHAETRYGHLMCGVDESIARRSRGGREHEVLERVPMCKLPCVAAYLGSSRSFISSRYCTSLIRSPTQLRSYSMGSKRRYINL